MTCEYFSRIEGKVFCRIYGRLKESNQEKILECESDFAECFERTNQTLMRKIEENTYSRFR